MAYLKRLFEEKSNGLARMFESLLQLIIYY